MIKTFFLISLFLSLNFVNAQSVLWSKMFDIHSINSLGGLSQNSVIDSDNNILTVVVENDVLKLKKLDSQGNVILSLNTNQECGLFSKIIKSDVDDFVFVYDNTPITVNSSLKLIHFNKNLEISQETVINFPISNNFYFSSFFEINNIYYFTGFTETAHIIYYLDNSNNLILKSISLLNNGSNEKISLLQNNQILIDFTQANNHKINYVSLTTGQLIWTKEFILNNLDTFQLEYKTIIGDNDSIYFAGLERTWISGQQNDVIKLRKLDNSNGNVILNLDFIPPQGCMQKMDDFKFNTINNHFYISYRSCFPNPNVVLVEFDSNFNLINQKMFPFVDDDLESGSGSSILFRENGNVIFTYSKFKNSLENGNLFIACLNADLTVNGSTELNIAPKNSSEALSDIMFFDNSKLLMTGLAPSTAQGILLEEVKYFLSMISVDELLSVEIQNSANSISTYPNPSKNILTIQTKETIKDVFVYDVLGKKVTLSQVSPNILDVSNLSKGLHIIKVIGENDKTFTSKFIKN